MLFFSKLCNFNMISRMKKIKNVALQVRIFRNKTQKKGKRVLPSASASGSMTVEAALILPLFLFGCVSLMMPFSIMNQERKVQAVLEMVTEDISQLAYGVQELEGRLPEGISIGETGQAFMEQAAWTAYAEVQVRTHLNTQGIKGLSLLESQILEDQETIRLVANYRVILPFPIFRMDSVARRNQSYRRAWVGKEGESGSSDSDQETEALVYVGQNSTRYHESRTCHYLYNQWSQVAWEEVENCRNSSGAIYYPCARCGSGAAGTVYIMPSGDSYHSTMSCSAVTAYVSVVKKSEVEHLGACSYCSGGERE